MPCEGSVTLSPRAGPEREDAQGQGTEGQGTEGQGCPDTLSPRQAQGASGLQITVPSMGQALTEVKGRAWVRGLEPDQGQQDEAGGQKQGQQIEQQQEAKEGEIGLDSSAKEACEENSTQSGGH